MNKLLAVIVLGTISMSALAQEVKLLCKIPGHSEIVTFDEKAETVNGKDVSRGEISYRNSGYITDTEISYSRYDDSHEWIESFYISRHDGVFKYDHRRLAGGNFKFGTCVPFKQAF